MTDPLRFVKRYWWLAIVVVIAIAGYRYFNPPAPVLTKSAGVQCADKYALPLVDPQPVDGVWICLSDHDESADP